jgi:hypothetical protein
MTGAWIEASRIGRRPKGGIYCEAVLLRYSKPEPIDIAIDKAIAGRTVFMRRTDAAAVLAALEASEGAMHGD